MPLQETQIEPCEKLASIADQYNVLHIARTVLDNWKFSLWSGSSKPIQHHYGKGGLAQHTLEVVELCLANAKYFGKKKVHERALFLAALFHDAGKMWDYQPIYKESAPSTESDYAEWEAAPHKRNIHHITRSALVWHGAVLTFGAFGFDPDEVLHAIIAHHGCREWGSPVTPNTHLAWLLHLCDGISARMDDGERRYNEIIKK